MKKKNNLYKFLEIGVFVLLGLLIFNSFFVFGIGDDLNMRINEVKELAKPAKIEIIKLESSCSYCFDINEVINNLKESDLEILSEKSLSGNSQEAIELINKYNIKKLPTIILKGEIEKSSIQDFKQVDDILVFDNIIPPYEDAVTKNVIGKVSSIIISDNNCDVCTDFNLIIRDIKQSGIIFIDKEEQIDFSNSRAKELIDKFNIKKLPVLLLSDDIDAYSSISQDIKQLGYKKDGYYVIESQVPYVEVNTGKIRGLVTLTMLDDSNCVECYDIEIHKEILGRLGLTINEEIKIDVSSNEGKKLISKYSIKNVPTVILTGDLDVYANFNTIWEQAGSVESDGAYIFRNLNILGRDIVYKDITTNIIIK